MKKWILPIIVILAGSINCAAAEGIEWHRDQKEATRLARETAKPILLDFTASWCKPCQMMDETFWTRPDIIELAKKFVCVKVNFDIERGLGDKYGVSTIPNVITTDPWGNGLNFSKGFGGDPQRIINGLLLVPDDFNGIKEANLRLETDKNDKTALSQIADFYNEKRFYYLGNLYWNRLLKVETDQARKEVLLINIGLNYLRGGDPKGSEDCFKRFQKEYPQSLNYESALFGLIYANILQKNWKGAEKYLGELRNAFPNSSYLAKAETDLAANKKLYGKSEK